MLQKEVSEGIIWEQELSEQQDQGRKGMGVGNEWWKGSRREWWKGRRKE